MLYAIIGLVIGCVAGFLLGIWYRKSKAKEAEAKIANADEEALRIVNDAIKSAETKKKEMLLEAKEEILRSRSEYEKEEKSRRADLQRQENRLQQKEENLDRKTEAMEKKEEALAQKHAAMDRENEEIKLIKQSQTAMLEKISGFTVEEAKKYLIDQVESEVTHETALKIKEVESRMKEECETRAREVVAQAIQRCAADQVAEMTVSVVPLPNDEMKGRIIGREGRNIRTIETLTGVDLIIDDTPEAITVSCFEPVRREIARLALEKLIADGRIHPTHIEEMVEKARREVDAVIKSEGERVTFEAGVRGLHPELVKMLGRLHYRTSYGQNVLQHSHRGQPHRRHDGRRAGRRCPGRQAGRPAPRPGQGCGPRDGRHPCGPGRGVRPEVQGEGGHHPRHRGPPQRRGAPDRGGLPCPGGRCHLCRPSRRPPREPGELHQAAGAAGEHLHAPSPAWRRPMPSRPAARSA